MKALSIKQPWAWLVCEGYKDVENRNWRTNFRGRVFIHASKQYDRDAVFPRGIDGAQQVEIIAHAAAVFGNDYPLGAIIGEVDIVDCVLESKSPWFAGKFGWVLKNPVLYDKPIPCKGKQRFFESEVCIPDPR